LYHRPEAGQRRPAVAVVEPLDGKFSSDRTIGEYAASVWKAEPCPVS
jgi:hypothetical protein